MPTFTLARVWCRSTRALHPARTEASSAMGNLLHPRGSRAVAAPVRARTAGFRPRSWVCTESTPARSVLRALPYSLRIWCEGLEEKLLERGAPAPLSVRLEGRLPCRPEFGAGQHVRCTRLGPKPHRQWVIYCAPEWRAPSQPNW